MSILRRVDSEVGLDAMPPNPGKRVERLRIDTLVPFLLALGLFAY